MVSSTGSYIVTVPQPKSEKRVERSSSAKADDNLETYLQTLVDRGGSFSSETISSRRSHLRRVASRTSGQIRVNSIACQLKHQNVSTELDSDVGQIQTQPPERDTKLSESTETETNKFRNKRRLNTCFHYYRYLMVVFGGFSLGSMLFVRYNITIAVLKMVNQTHLYMEEHPGSTMDDMIAAGQTPGGEFNWNNEIQQMIMSWYMLAYTLPQLALTRLGSIIGLRLTVPIALSFCAVATLLTPMFAYLGWQYVIFLRLVNGFGAGPVLPMLIGLLESWFPANEVPLGLGIAQCLCVLMSALNPLISGYLTSIHWSLAFYVPGAILMVFNVLWLVLVSDEPESNAFISSKELEHIGGYSYQDELDANGKPISKKELDYDEDDYKADSWTAILRVPSFYAYLGLWILHCSSFNGFVFLLPTYLVQFLKIKVTQNGLYCAIIQMGCILAVIWPHPVLVFLRTKLHLSDPVARRVVMAICCLMMAFTWIFVGVFHRFQLVLFSLNRCFQNGVDVIVTSTIMMNYVRAGYSSLAFSAVNTVGCLSVVFSSTLIGWFLDYTGQSRTGWCIILSGLGLVQFVVLLIYSLIPVGPIRFRKSSPLDTQDKARESRKCGEAISK